MSLIRARYRAVNTIMNLPRGGFVGLLDLFPNAAAAYSLRLLRKNYSGGLTRVRAWDGVANQGEAEIMPRRIDAQNYVIDLNSKLEDLDATAISRGLTTNDTLADLVLSGTSNYDGFVSGWRDQSLSNDATQTTAANQPKIVSAGSLVTENGKPAIDFDGDKSLVESSVVLSQPFSYFGVRKYNNDGLNREVFVQQNVGSFNVLIDISFGLNHANFGSYINGDTETFNQNLRYILANGASSQVQDNGGTLYTDDGGINGVNGLRIGFSPLTNFFNTNLKGQEVIIYDSDQSSNRVAISANINTFYSIYP